MIILLVILLAIASAALSAPVPDMRGGTNLWIISNAVERRAWRRTALMAGPDDSLLDPSGQIADYASAAAQAATNTLAGQISDAARISATNSIAALSAVTNDIPPGAVHIAISVTNATPANLVATVVAERWDGTNDWQDVRYSQLLASPPIRHVDYSYPGPDGIITASVRAIWDLPWDPASLVHTCRLQRPLVLQGVPAVYRSRRVDILGGPQGFSFGPALVRVNQVPTFTGTITNAIDGSTLTFKNGALTNDD